MINKSLLVKTTVDSPYYNTSSNQSSDINYSTHLPGCNYKCQLYLDINVEGYIISLSYNFIGDFVLKYLLHILCSKLIQQPITLIQTIYEDVLTNQSKYIDIETFDYIKTKRGYKTFSLLQYEINKK